MPHNKTIYDDKKTSPVEKLNFKQRGVSLEAEGRKFYSKYKDLSRFENPTRGYFYDSKPNQLVDINHRTLLDSHPRRAIRDSASGMMSGFTSPSRPWFKVETPDPDLNDFAPVKRQLDEVTRRMTTVMATSNSYDMHYSVYEEILTFGTACAMVLEDFLDVIRGRSFTAGEYFIGMDETGRLNAFYRKIWKTVSQLVKQFGIENVSAEVKNLYETNKPDSWRLINHLIEDNDNRVPFFKDFKNMPYRSIYWEEAGLDEKYLRKGGYEENPVLAPRWHTRTSSDTYGYGPGWDALGNAKSLQKETSDKMLGIEKVINPPVQKDSSVQGDVNTLPGGITTFSAQLPNAGLKPAYQIRPDIGAIREDINEIRKAISEDFYADLFKMLIELDRGQITAFEIAQRQAEKLSMLAPFTERLNNEYLNPFINRVFNIMLRAQLFPEFPPELQGMDLRVKYISLMAQAQKQIGIASIEQTIGFAGKIGEVNPSVMDNINWDEAIIIYSDMAGAPAKMINSREEVAKIRQARAVDEENLKRAEKMKAGAEAAAKAGKAIKDTSEAELNKGSALDGIMDTIQAQNQ